jgi:glycine hydroxymethyltransferase
MAQLKARPWVPKTSETLIQRVAKETAEADADALGRLIDTLVTENLEIHERDCINLNPATNVMNPHAEAVLAKGLGTRPSLGYPGEKYEMGLEAIEHIEVIAAELAAEIFDARYAEIRVPSGAIANLMMFMAATKPGDVIIVPPSTIGGHVTHHRAGAAGLYGLDVREASADPHNYSVDLERLRRQAKTASPKLITIGGSLNLFRHPVREIRAIADEVGALVLYDAAHMSGMIAGRAWQQPLKEGAHAMTMSTYKSLGGPPAGLIVTNDTTLAKRFDEIAFPGLTANFDAAKTTALAITLLDWKVYGRDYAKAMAGTAKALADHLAAEGLTIYARERGYTSSHQFALEASRHGGGQTAARHLRRANILSCGIGLPGPSMRSDVNGLRLGTPEIVRRGMGPEDMGELARLIAGALEGDLPPERLANDVTAFRRRFSKLKYIRN